MAAIQNFRSAFNGFNREDVVRYIEYINSNHNSQLEQLNTQLQTAREELAQAKAALPVTDNSLLAQLEAARARCAELEAQLAEKEKAASAETDELEAYRRAERAERKAHERAAQIYTQANAVLADATVKVETASGEMCAMAEEIAAKLQSSRDSLQEAVSAMYAIRPEGE